MCSEFTACVCVHCVCFKSKTNNSLSRASVSGFRTLVVVVHVAITANPTNIKRDKKKGKRQRKTNMFTGRKIRKQRSNHRLKNAIHFRRNQTIVSRLWVRSKSLLTEASYCFAGCEIVVHLCITTITIWFPCSSYTWPIQPIDPCSLFLSSKHTHSHLYSQINTFSFCSFSFSRRCLFRIFIVIIRLLFSNICVSFRFISFILILLFIFVSFDIRSHFTLCPFLSRSSLYSYDYLQLILFRAHFLKIILYGVHRSP